MHPLIWVHFCMGENAANAHNPAHFDTHATGFRVTQVKQTMVSKITQPIQPLDPALLDRHSRMPFAGIH